MVFAVEDKVKAGSSEGTMFFDMGVLPAYELARKYAGNEGRVAAMPDLVGAKIYAGPNNPIWRRYITTTSGEFYGISKGGTPIIVVAHGIDDLLKDKKTIARSTKDSGGNSKLKLTTRQFRRLENGEYGSAQVLDWDTVMGMREYPASVLSYNEAMKEPLLRARLGPEADKLLTRHREITLKESGNEFILINDHKYEDVKAEDVNTGGLLVFEQLVNRMSSGEDRAKSGIQSEINLSDLKSDARFIAIEGKGKLREVDDRLEEILSDVVRNWPRLLVPNNSNKDMF